METTNEDWVNNECGDYMWDDALNAAERVSASTAPVTDLGMRETKIGRTAEVDGAK